MALQKFEGWLRKHLPEGAAALRPGASEAALIEMAREIGLELPEEFKELYRWHDGQAPGCTGVFYGLEFLPLSSALAEWRFGAEQAATLTQAEPAATAVVRSADANRHWIPFAADFGGNFLAIDLQPGPRGAHGQVINYGRDEFVQYALAPNVSEFVAWIVAELARGNFSIEEGDDKLRPFNMAEPATQHLLDATKIVFGGVRPTTPKKPSGPPRDSTPGVFELIRSELVRDAHPEWRALRLRARVSGKEKKVTFEAHYSLDGGEQYQPLHVTDRRTLEEAVLELQARTKEENWHWSKITLDYSVGESSIAVDAE